MRNNRCDAMAVAVLKVITLTVKVLVDSVMRAFEQIVKAVLLTFIYLTYSLFVAVMTYAFGMLLIGLRFITFTSLAMFIFEKNNTYLTSLIFL